MPSAYLYDAVRTPFGRYGGALAGVRPDDLAAPRRPDPGRRGTDLDPARVDEVVLGNANGAGEDNRNVARMATPARRPRRRRPRDDRQPALRVEPRRRDHRLPPDRPRRRRRRPRRRRGVDEPRSVGAAQAVEGLPRAGRRPLVSTTLGWRLVNKQMPAGVDGLARRGRPSSCATATASIASRRTRSPLRSHRLAAAAWAAGFYDDLVGRRSEASTSPATSRSAPDTTTGHARRASSRCSAPTAPSPPATPRRSTTAPRRCCSAREPSPARTGLEPRSPGSPGAAPSPSTRSSSASPRSRRPTCALERAGIGWADVGAVELNEAFAAQSLACVGRLGRRPRPS